MRPGTPTMQIKGKILAESAKAIQFQIHSIAGYPEDQPFKSSWFPLSQTSKITHAKPESEELDELTVSVWIMQQKGYEYE
jgi:hypothetical protein